MGSMQCTRKPEVKLYADAGKAAAICYNWLLLLHSGSVPFYHPIKTSALVKGIGARSRIGGRSAHVGHGRFCCKAA